MEIIHVRNVHQALPKALNLLDAHGVTRDSRNGVVKMAPWPVATVYQRPMERVIFWPERDANPFFHLYEALWMLQGRNDLAPLLRYAKQMSEYSDNQLTLWGAYGHRWRIAAEFDQLEVIANRLRANPEDRRCVLEMWMARADLGRDGRDVPCNVTATFQVGPGGALEATVFNRSNDIVWGAYGANAVHFSLLQEYLAIWIGRPIGVYRQISVNWHAYLRQGVSEPFAQVSKIPRDTQGDPYTNGKVSWLPLTMKLGAEAVKKVDGMIAMLLSEADNGFKRMFRSYGEPFFDVAYHVLYAHHCYKTLEAPTKFTRPLEVLAQIDAPVDWKVAAREWIERRQKAWEAKQ